MMTVPLFISVALSEVVKLIVAAVIAIAAKMFHKRYKDKPDRESRNMDGTLGATDNTEIIKDIDRKLDDIDERVTKMESVLFGYDEFGLFEGYITIMENHDDEIQENAVNIEENAGDIDELKQRIDECEEKRQEIVERVDRLVNRSEQRKEGDD